MKMKNLKKIDVVEFPKSKGININMMPFIMGDMATIPEEYRHYAQMIEACNIPKSEIGKVGYLTITESDVTKGESQRRGGVHVEKHPNRNWGGGGGAWGGYKGGLYMSSNVSNSCRVWDHYVEDPGNMGDCEHLRNDLGEGELLQEGELVWMTDGTPHESMSIEEGTHRQFFRLVTSEVSVWYEDHSTRNRLGIDPNAEIIKGSKF
jgi:hypothetical protein